MALSLLLSIFLLWSLVSTATAFNITKILDQHPDYAVFNQLLTKTHVAQEINKRKSITVLAVPNGAVSGITGQDEETLKVIMKIHVVLDYYDSAKIKKIKDDTTLTTLYQTTGSADKEEGFLRIIKDDNDIKLTSAVSGSSVTARVSKVVTSIPSDISVVEVSNAIMPPGLDGSPISPSPSSTSKHKSPSPSPNKSSSPKSSDAPDADDSKSAPSDSDAPAPSPKGKDHGHGHKHKHKHAPASAPAPSDDSADADADDDDADADADDSSSPDEEDNSTGDEDDDSSSPRNAAVSGFVLLASLFAML
ncbi:fasciclin-like arabinogalactan protein 14 [Cynara cardunculus var. scolymus]|uniref:fasciclin-like arabinogalactan protein 14 n=1 Tax=Cynara cardunculus var. scolymus TaxID=59895 RepID=UPI000D623C7D|nr:fasciclin-like arabinogalactan protein 14 [Cynara cardunculus var. scolymus]